MNSHLRVRKIIQNFKFHVHRFQAHGSTFETRFPHYPQDLRNLRILYWIQEVFPRLMKLVQSQTYFSSFALSMITTEFPPSVYFVLSFCCCFKMVECNMKQSGTNIFFWIFFLAGRTEHDILYPLKDLLDWTKLRHLDRNRFPAIFSFLDFPTNPEIFQVSDLC